MDTSAGWCIGGDKGEGWATIETSEGWCIGGEVGGCVTMESSKGCGRGGEGDE